MKEQRARAYALGLTLIAAMASVAAADPAGCHPITGVEELLVPGRVLLLGELHGTVQSPSFVGDLVCHAAGTGAEVSVGLELDPAMRPDIEAFFASEGPHGDREILVRHDVWQRSYQDGRNSLAMAELIDRLRHLRASGSRLRIVLFDASGAGGGQQRERDMASILAGSIKAKPEAIHVILTGNAHSRIVEGARGNPNYEPMGYLLAAEFGTDRLLALDAGYENGSAWVCNPDCGVSRLRGRSDGPAGSIEIDESSRPSGHDGWYHVGPMTASPPAIERLRQGFVPEQPNASAEAPPVRKTVKDDPQPRASASTRKWQGHWQAYSYNAKYWTIQIDDRSFHAVLGPDDWYKGRITLRSDAEPAEIDFHIEDCRCTYKGETSSGIYKWEGESIILAAPQPGRRRPTLFNLDTGEVVRLVQIEE